ncbi:MAG: 2-hydroxyacyl-CoA dehydratase family protein [Dehalococcoidales bacterium]|nr:2-hydroxyacyl-CoA dehydratase family protein [Dehalococcoidales bacterium]
MVLPAKDKVADIVRACRLIRRMTEAQPGHLKSRLLYYDMLIRYFTRILRARENGDFIAAHSVFFPAEVLYAMGLVPMHTESTTWMISLFPGECADMISEGASLGLAAEICTPHRGLAGAYSLRALPRPDVMLWSNMVCDNTAKCGELIMEVCGCPGFFLDRPFKNSEREIAYLAGELEDMVRFLEERSGRRMDWENLAATVARMDEQIELVRRINELRKHVPTPFSPLGFLELVSVDYLFPGQPEAIEYLKTLYGELEERVAQGRGALPEERFRLMTLFIPPMYLMNFLEDISRQYGAVSVIEPFFTYWGEGRLDPSRPLESVARKSYLIPEMRMYGPLDSRAIDGIVKCARDYRVDGAIYYADVGCRHSCAVIKLFKDVLNEMDIPVLVLDCDVVDPTATSKEEMKAKFEQFFELLEDR